MLVLTRKKNERIFINGNIAITIVKISGNTIRIGIDAPEDTLIVREEVAIQNARQKEAIAKYTKESRGQEKDQSKAPGKNHKAPNGSMGLAHFKAQRSSQKERKANG